MNCFFSYIKHNFRYLLIILLWGIVMASVMALNEVPEGEIFYGILLCVFFLFVAGITGFCNYIKKYRSLKAAEDTVMVSVENLPEAKGAVEEEYQILIRLLLEDKNRLEDEGIRKQRDLKEYYTMWVHQIKTPISALKLLQQENAESEHQAEEAQELFRIEQYVEMALQYMRLDAESTDFILKKTELDTMIREAVHKYARQFIYKKISLHYESVDTSVLTDEKWLEFVIEQLLSNAVKYTTKGVVSVYMEDGRLVIADTGIGIRSEDLPRVCEKGYTGYNGHVDKRSTGIGLYLCSRILKKLGHTLTITSEEGKGTRAVIGFPEETEF